MLPFHTETLAMHFVPSIPELLFLFLAIVFGTFAAIMIPRYRSMAFALVFCDLLATMLSPADLLSTFLLMAAFILVLLMGRRMRSVQDPFLQSSSLN